MDLRTPLLRRNTSFSSLLTRQPASLSAPDTVESDRGYESIERDLGALGAHVRRETGT